MNTTTKEGRESFAKMHTDAAIKLERLRAKRRAINRELKALNADIRKHTRQLKALEQTRVDGEDDWQAFHDGKKLEEVQS